MYPQQDPWTALAIDVRWGEERDVVSLAGEFDFAATSRVGAVIKALLTAGRRRVLVDLDEVTFMDGAAVGVLVRGSELMLQVGGALEVTEHPMCLRVLRTTGELECLTVHRSATEVVDDSAPAACTGIIAQRQRQRSESTK